MALQIIGVGGSDWLLNSAVMIQNSEYSGIPSFWMPGAAPLVLWTNRCNMPKFAYNVNCYYMRVFNVVSNNSPKSFIGYQHWAWNNIKIRKVGQEANRQRSRVSLKSLRQFLFLEYWMFQRMMKNKEDLSFSLVLLYKEDDTI